MSEAIFFTLFSQLVERLLARISISVIAYMTKGRQISLKITSDPNTTKKCKRVLKAAMADYIVWSFA